MTYEVTLEEAVQVMKERLQQFMKAMSEVVKIIVSKIQKFWSIVCEYVDNYVDNQKEVNQYWSRINHKQTAGKISRQRYQQQMSCISTADWRTFRKYQRRG